MQLVKKNTKTLTVVLSYTIITCLIIITAVILNTTISNTELVHRFQLVACIGIIMLNILFFVFFYKTERKENKNITSRLNYLEQRYKTIFDYTSNAILILKGQTIVEANKRAHELLQRNKFQLLNKSLYSLLIIPEEKNILNEDEFEKILSGYRKNDLIECPCSFTLPSGDEINTETILLKTGIHNEELTQVIIKDNSRHLSDQLQIAESERKYQEIVENANTAIIKFNLEGKLTYVNEFTERLYGYETHEIYGKYIFEVFNSGYSNRKNKKNTPNPKKMMNRILHEINTNPTKENWNFTHSGKKIFMSWTSKPIYDINKNLVGVLSVGVDRTEHKIMYDRLIINENKFKTVFNSTYEGITIISLDGNILAQNTKALDFFGFNKSDVGEHTSTKDLIRSLTPDFDLLLNKILMDGEITFEVEAVSAQNKNVTAEITAKISEYEGKKAILAVSRDITERKLQQKKIFNTAVIAEEKERSRVAKELHDSVSPVLSAAKLYAQTLKDTQDKTLQNEIISKIGVTINEAVQGIYEISNNLSPHVLENFGLVEAVNSFIERIPKDNIVFEVNNNINQRLNPTIETTLYRVTTELINNSLKHSKASSVYITYILNKNINMEYIDNGIGFNTHDILENSKGMGIFNITNRIKSINGKINLNSTENKGTQIEVSIPNENEHAKQ